MNGIKNSESIQTCLSSRTPLIAQGRPNLIRSYERHLHSLIYMSNHQKIIFFLNKAAFFTKFLQEMSEDLEDFLDEYVILVILIQMISFWCTETSLDAAQQINAVCIQRLPSCQPQAQSDSAHMGQLKETRAKACTSV